MEKIYITQIGTQSNWPIRETRHLPDGSVEVEESVAIELTDKQSQSLEDGSVEIKFVEGEPTLIPSTRKAEREAQEIAEKEEREAAQAAAQILKKKLEKGEATLEEIQQTLANLL